MSRMHGSRSQRIDILHSQRPSAMAVFFEELCHRYAIVWFHFWCSILLTVLFAVSSHAQRSHLTWSDYLGGSDSAHYSALTQINRSNVGQLEMAWSYPTADKFSYGFSPLVVDNTMFVLA